MDGFVRLCEQVRFSLDESPRQSTGGEDAIAEFVAQVRARALLVTPTTVPMVYQVSCRVRDALALEDDPEIYVVNDPCANAFAPGLGVRRRPIIVLNSGLVGLLSPSELGFTIAHELGHLALGHMRRIDRNEIHDEFGAFQARCLERYAEVSADRVALVSSKSVFIAAHVMVKLASGLGSEALGLDVDGFVRQIERDPEEVSRGWELSESHPSLPFRLWALVLFARSTEFGTISGQATHGDRLTELDDMIAQRFAELGDGRLTQLEDSVFQRAVVWTGLAMVTEDDRVDTAERKALARLIGPERARKAVAFAKSHGHAVVLKKLREALSQVTNASLATRRKLERCASAFAVSLDRDLAETAAGRVLAACLKRR